MDIKSLLSPQDTPVQTPGSSHPPTSAPLANGQHYIYAKSHEPSQPRRMPPPQRHSSSSMDTLADLASMQQYQASVRSTSSSLRNPDLQSPVASPSISNAQNGSYPSTPTRARSVSYLRHNEPPPRSTPISTPLSEGDLPIMEQAVLLGEDSWIQKIHSAIAAARTIQDRVGIMELCAQAVAEEPHSPRLCQLYGDWMWFLYKRSHDLSGVYETSPLEQLEVAGGILAEQSWPQEDVLVGKEVFPWQQMMDTWRRGAENTQWHLDNSNLVWDPYLELNTFELTSSPSPTKYNDVYNVYHRRLETPHRTWEATKNAFVSFVARFDERNVQQAVADAGKLAQKFQSAYDLRAHRENILSRAMYSGDKNQERHAFEDYLVWEESQHRQKTSRGWGHNLYIALLQRATIRFPRDVEFWLDNVTFLMEPGHQAMLLEVAERATKYCPASGDLWAQRLYAAEYCGRPYKEIETIKHNATSTGQLEDGSGMQELIKVESAWCGYLRRTAFSPNAPDDSKDVAEVAIRSAIENVARVGRDKFGDAYQGDPEFRVERIFLKFLTQDGRYNDAREIFAQLEHSHGDSHFFWERRYLYEIAVWEASQDRSVSATSQSVPSMATAALKRAIQRPNMDWPEKIIEMYMHHCTQHESAKALLEAQIEARKASKRVARRRREERAQYEQQQAAYEQAQRQEINGKRTREDGDVEMSDTKRARTDQPAERPPFNDPSSSANAQLRRDREHTTVVVRHLPADATEHGIRQYFRDCGEINAITLIKDDLDRESTATIEFKSQEDVLTAQTKSMKTFGDKAIEVQVGSGTTLWVTNYPPDADETYLRNLFKPYGDVVEVRFPSLKSNTRRRFCYIQFLTSNQASQASATLHGRALEHNHRLTALISEPGGYKERVGASYEGREIYVGNFHWTANEADLRQFLDSHGCAEHIELIRIPKKMNGMSKGVAFVNFASKQEAEIAAERIDKQLFRGRILTVNVSDRHLKGAKTSSTTIVRDRRGSTAASEASSSQQAGGAGSPTDTPMDDAESTNSAPTKIESFRERGQRTLALLGIPDTVNDARIQALCQTYGPLVKIILRPENGGALVEFENTEDKRKAEFALDGYKITPGNRLRPGQPREVMRHADDASDQRGGKASSSSRGGRGGRGGGRGGLAPSSVSRPGFGAGGKNRGRGGRPGLGFTRAAVSDANSENGDGGKNQNDFRALLANGGNESKDSEQSASATGSNDVKMVDGSAST